jgi:hypothetical protein
MLVFFLLWNSAVFKSEKCSIDDTLLNTNNIIKELDKCCACKTKIPVPPDTIVPTPPDTSTPPPPPPPPPRDAKPCDSGSMQDKGVFGVKETKYILGVKSGKVTIHYKMENKPDKLEVFYEGKRIASTFSIPGNVDGFVGGDNAAGAESDLQFNYIHHIDQYVTVRVTGKDAGTEWSYTLGCPK